jgi:putative ATPase
MELFKFDSRPLPERMRPTTLSEIVGQGHLVGEGGILTKLIKNGALPSMILWGPPGVGKTTLALVLAKESGKEISLLSAINAGVKDLREVIEYATKHTGHILFIDEIHRFNKSQQDALLKAVEDGTIVLIGATTENPSFEVNKALLSRCRVYTLKDLSREDLIFLLHDAIARDEVLKTKKMVLKETEAIINLSGGDARRLLNLLEQVVQAGAGDEIVVSDELVLSVAQNNTVLYDKNGEQHYDIISAFIKSIRGSDPNAAIYYLARMIAGGEDVKFIARRLLILASEDIGNANPNALLLAQSTFQAVSVIGYPESDIILSQCVSYLASSPKSNSAVVAIKSAAAFVQKTGNLPVPLHLRNAVTAFMKQEGYGKDYQYSHDFEGNFVNQEFLPDAAKGTVFYNPGKNAREEELRKHLRNLWKEKYGY